MLHQAHLGYWERLFGKGSAGRAFGVGTMVRQIIVAGFVVFLPAGLGAQGRGAITEDMLDLDATRQFNEQRGLSLRLAA